MDHLEHDRQSGGNRLTRRIGTAGRDLLALVEQLAQRV